MQAGLGEDKVKAIAEGRRLVGVWADEEALYNFIELKYLATPLP